MEQSANPAGPAAPSPTPTPAAQVLMKRGRRGAASHIHSDCSSSSSAFSSAAASSSSATSASSAASTAASSASSSPRLLNELLDILLNPGKNIDEWETIDWCKWLMAGGRTPDEFASVVRRYDNATTCGLVWTANFVAYRCRTCGISPCMSLCADCFKHGDHDGHDFNMFRSQAGGACDCGDTSVMKETGFCAKHGPKAQVNKPTAPFDLMCVAEAVMPRIILRLIQHLRENSKSSSLDYFLVAIQDADGFLSMLHDLSAMGAAMRKVMTSSLTNPQIYKHLTECKANDDSAFASYMIESQKMYEEAVKTLANPKPPHEYKDCPALQEYLNHKTFLEELVFWTVKFEFPQKVVCLLLNMLPDPDYKEALTQAFVLHYSRISVMLERSTDPDTLSNRVVHVSVQLFSNEALALRMADKLSLLHVMVISLKYMMSKILIPNTLHVKDRNRHKVVDCGRQVMKEHCYWPLVSDLNNVLSHRPVAVKFMSDSNLLEMWFKFLSVFQGMNVNQREITQHVEFEPNTYYAAFSAELEASAYPMWALLSHLWDASSVQLTKRVLNACLAALQDWLEAIGMNQSNMIDDTWSDNHQVSFHLPLHRYLSVFMCQAVNVQGVPLAEVLPPPDVLHLIMMHPLRVQVAFYEILNGLWVRNGLQIKGQAMTYIQCNFCNSMVDSDLYLLQVCATQLPPETFLQTVIDKFHVNDWLSFSASSTSASAASSCSTAGGAAGATSGSSAAFVQLDTDTPMLESCLTFLASLISLRTNLGVNSTLLSQLEMVTLLCMGDKTHSQLMELIPERCGTAQSSRDFEAVLAEVAEYRAPNLEASGHMQQGMYVPKARVWQRIYDPLHVLLRAVHRRDFQTSMDRYAEHVHQTGKLKSTSAPWPPYRHPAACHSAYSDPRRVLCSRVFHALAWVILYKAVNNHSVSEHVISLLIYLLEMCIVATTDQQEQPTQVCSATTSDSVHVNDLEFSDFFESDWLSNNLRTRVVSVTLSPEPAVVINTSDSEDDFFEQLVSGALELDFGEPGAASSSTPALPEPSSSSSPSAPSSSNAVARQGGGAYGGHRTQTVGQDRSIHNAIMEGLQSQNRTGYSNSMLIPAASLLMDLYSNTSNPQPLPITAAEMQPDAAAAGAASSSSSAVATQQSMQLICANAAAASADVSYTNRLAALPSTSGAGQRSADSAAQSGTTTAVVQKPCCQVSRPKPPYGTSGAKSRLHPRNRMLNQFSNEMPTPPEKTVNANESIISLLLKLHSHLSGVPDSFNPDEPDPDPDSRIGDGPVFVGKLLRRIMALDTLCRENVVEVRERLWPRQPEEGEAERREREERERGERRRRAKERQQKLMEEFASQQKQFMEKTMETEDDGMEWEGGGEETGQMLSNKKEYDCVICNQTSPSTDEKLMGLAVLVQATSVLGHKRRSSEPAVLPTSDQERANFSRNDTLGSDFDRRIEEIDRHFDKLSWLVSVNLGWEGGVHVQTCGHHLHLDCLKSYLRSLLGQQRIAAERGEYSCPLCRQLANSVLPLPPQLGDCAAVVRSRPSSLSNSIFELTNFLKDNLPAMQTMSSLMVAMSKLMEDMTNSTYLKCKQEIFGNCNPQMLFLFVSSVARTNLEIELVQRGGTLCALPSLDQSLIPKRSCIMPLLHVLAEHAKKLAQWPAWETWQQLAGTRGAADGAEGAEASAAPAVIPTEPPMPLLLRDPTALLTQFILLLPLHLDQTYFSTVVKLLYNLIYFQVVVQLSCTMKERQRSWWRKREPQTPCTSLEHAMSLVISSLDPTHLYAGEEEEEEEEEDEEAAEKKERVEGEATEQEEEEEGRRDAAMEVDQNQYLDKEELELKTQQLCLPFLRVAALLRHHLYEQPLPEVDRAKSEFVRLVYYLELVTEGMEWRRFNAAVALSWPTSDAAHIRDWTRHLGEFIRRSQPVARSFLSEQHLVWHQPRLLTLPQLYDKIFQYYHRRQCQQCHSVPRETSICLLCGALVCLKENCCKQSNICEAVQHSLDCGAGTAMYLVVTSSYVIVIRGKRACLWGSVYLDNFGEEDRELKRGKPLYLSPGRYQLLQQQWLAHRFDHTNKKWVWHRDAL